MGREGCYSAGDVMESSPPLPQALSQALLQVRSDLVETAQKTLEDHDRHGMEEANVQELVERRTSELQVSLCACVCVCACACMYVCVCACVCMCMCLMET